MRVVAVDVSTLGRFYEFEFYLHYQCPVGGLVHITTF